MELEKLTALQLGEKIKQRQVSVLDGVKTVFEQIEKQDSEVHAYLDTYKEEAYKRAEEVQKGIEDGTYTSPLAGVPIAIKDNICINGKKTTCASKILENFVPQYNAEVIDRLEKAGLVIIGKTNMDEFAMIFSLYILPVTFYIAFISDLFTVPDGSYLEGRDRFHEHSLHQ